MSNNLKPLLARLAAGTALSEAEAEAAFDIIMSGEATPAQIGGLLIGGHRNMIPHPNVILWNRSSGRNLRRISSIFAARGM